jgi:hypothetical protein
MEENLKIMHYKKNYHINLVSFNPRTKERKGIISYYKKNEITTLKKHVDVYHVLFAKIIDEELSGLVKILLEIQLAKKKLNVFSFKISKKIGAKDFFKQDVVPKKDLYKTLAFYLSKIPTCSICQKYTIEAFCNAITLKNCVSFQKFQ